MVATATSAGAAGNNLVARQRTKASMAWQFRIRTLLLATLYVACIVAWVKWNWPVDERYLRNYSPWRHYFPGVWGLVACGLMLSAGLGRLCGRTKCASWTWLLFGGTIALARHAEGVWHCFSCMGHCNECDYRDEAINNLRQTLTLPVAVGVPLAVALFPTRAAQRPRGDRLAMAAFALAVGNVVLLNATLIGALSLACDLRIGDARIRSLTYNLRSAGETNGIDSCCASSASDSNDTSKSRSTPSVSR